MLVEGALRTVFDQFEEGGARDGKEHRPAALDVREDPSVLDIQMSSFGTVANLAP